MRFFTLFLLNFVFINAFSISSPAFNNNSYIPKKYTCDGKNVSIPLIIKDIPENTKSLAVIMQDHDAPFGIFTHWILYNLQPSLKKIPENLPKLPIINIGFQGINDFRKTGYGGPCPPYGNPHRYIITVVALNKKTNLPPDLTIKRFLDKIRPYVIGTTTYTGIYKRSGK